MHTANINTSSPLSAPSRILIAEDKPEIRDYLQLALRRPNFIIDFAEDGEEVLSILATGVDTPALIILDVATTSKNGPAVLQEIRDQHHKLPVVTLSGVAPATNHVDALEDAEVSTTPVTYEELPGVVDGLLQPAPLGPVSKRPSGFLGRSEQNLKTGNWVRGMEPLLSRLAICDAPVLLQGETGVGKEVLARHIHHQSLRSGKIFLKLNCAALPAELVESELFGYERGAFTGAFKSTPGKFELANGGTILLDEIGDMDLRLQAKLLQVLQDREFHRIGAKDPTQVDVRVIAATHRKLEERISQGEFREDLYYRLNVLNIVIPPLRERLDEIIPLAFTFLKKHATAGTAVPDIGPSLRNALLSHQWPGNIRELENVMRRYLIIRNPDLIVEELHRHGRKRSHGGRPPGSSLEHGALSRSFSDAPANSEAFGEAMSGREQANRVPQSTSQYSVDHGEGDGSELAKLDQVRQAAETEVIMKALYSTQWNRKRAATLLGVDYKALLYRMKKLGID